MIKQIIKKKNVNIRHCNSSTNTITVNLPNMRPINYRGVTAEITLKIYLTFLILYQWRHVLSKRKSLQWRRGKEREQNWMND